jgi:IMP dehydrogenase
MKFLNGLEPSFDLTYSDVFMVPGLSDVGSRFAVDLTPTENIGTTMPIVVSNMNAVAGRRMAETIARRGGVSVIPQDLSREEVEKIVSSVKKAHPIFDTPITLKADDTVYTAMELINKRAHGTVVIVDDADSPIGIFTSEDARGWESFSKLENFMSRDVLTLDAQLSPEQMYHELERKRLNAAPVIQDGKVVGIMTQKNALRSTLYQPALNQKNELMIAAAIGINGDPAERATWLHNIGVDILVVDTAHGHQKKAIDAVAAVRAAVPSAKIVAGNVVTKQATLDLIAAGADIIKVGVGPGAMCTTRMMTGVGRPQFSAVLECAEAAKSKGKHVWADGGVRYARDVALALAAGASSVMIGSWFGGTYEAAADVQVDVDGRMYKENYGMASKRAVTGRVGKVEAMERARKELYEEGISSSRLYLDPERPGVEDIVDQIIAGVRSSCTYAGATHLSDFHENAVVGIQSASGYKEGHAVDHSWY